MALRSRMVAKTDVGIQRARNEDSFLVDDALNLCVVADGMGGHLGGDIASEIATHTLRDYFHEHATYEPSRKRDSELIREAIGLANANVFEQGNANDHLRDMGTTVVATWFRGDYVVAASVGDSRIYRLRTDVLEQITIDHSWVGELRRRRLISEVEAHNHPLKNIITRALGMDKKVAVDVFIEDIRDDDLYLLCTDGLTDFVDDARIQDILEHSADDLDGACARLIELANFIAGADNITVGLVSVSAP